MIKSIVEFDKRSSFDFLLTTIADRYDEEERRILRKTYAVDFWNLKFIDLESMSVSGIRGYFESPTTRIFIVEVD